MSDQTEASLYDARYETTFLHSVEILLVCSEGFQLLVYLGCLNWHVCGSWAFVEVLSRRLAVVPPFGTIGL